MTVRARSTLTPRRSRHVPGLGVKRLEKHEQADGVKLLASLGGRPYISGTRRRRDDYQGTNQTAGIADVEFFMPAPRYGRPLLPGLTRRLLKWECKRPGGKATPAQREYADLSRAAGIAHVLGDLNALYAWLVAEGYLRRDLVPHDRQPKAAPIPAAPGGPNADHE